MQIGFIGAGKMAQALAGGIAQANPQVQFFFVDPNPDAQYQFVERVHGRAKRQQETNRIHRIHCVASSREVFEQCEMIFLAVKPQLAVSALAGLVDSGWPALPPQSKLIVSVMAGITIAKIRELTGQIRIVRVMPNTPCLIGKGASAFAISDEVSETEKLAVVQFLESLGTVEQVAEELLDAVTGLSGSGPAYVFAFVEALIRGGIAAGLPTATADRLARQTVLGAAAMVCQPNSSPAELRQQVTSPGGTTLAGLAQLEKHEFEQAVIDAVLQASARSKELGQI